MPTYSSTKRPYELKNELLTQKRRGEDPPERREAYSDFAGRVRHISQFVVDVLGVQASAVRTPESIRESSS
jgi:hypothetical protein